MKSALFSSLKDKYDGLNSREKWLFKIALAVVFFLLLDRVLISPLRNYNDELNVKIAEKSKLLTDFRNYLSHKELQKDLFKGKASDFLSVFMQIAKESQLGTIRLKKTENSDKGILIQFEGEGNIQKILDFTLKLEKMNFVVLFQRLDISLIKGSEYSLKAEIQVVKG